MSTGSYRGTLRLVLVLVLAYCLALAQTAAAARIVYGSKSPAFSVDMPKNWKFAGDKEGFAQFNNGKGAYFWVQRSQMDKLKPEELLGTYNEQGYTVVGNRSDTVLSGNSGGKFILERSEGGVAWKYEVTEVYRAGVQWVFFSVAPKSAFNTFVKEFAAIYGKLKIEGSDNPVKATVNKTPVAPAQPQLSAKQTKAANEEGQPPALTQASKQNQPQAQTRTQNQVQVPESARSDGNSALQSKTSEPVRNAQQYSVQTTTQTPPRDTAQTAIQSAKATESAISATALKLAYVKDGHVQVYDMAAGKTLDIGPGRDPQLSHSGDKLLYLAADGIRYLFEFGTNARNPVLLPDGAEEIRLSPDGSRIAYSIVRQYYFPSTYQQCRSFLADLAGNVIREFKGYAPGKAESDRVLTNMNGKVGYKSPAFTPNPDKTLLAVQIGYAWNVVMADNKAKTISLVISGGEGALMSPDGKWIIYSRPMDDNHKRLWLCTSDGGNHRDLGTTTGAYVWSPDSAYIVYENGGALYKLEIQSGTRVLYMSDVAAPSLSMG